MAISPSEIKDLQHSFPDSKFIFDSQDENLLHTILRVNHIYNDFHVNELFEIDINIPLTYPSEIPEIIEIGNKIDIKYEHLYSNGKLCLGTDSEIILRCNGVINLTYLINSYIIPYLFSYRYYERYNEYPFGERSHGAMGILESCIEAFSVANIQEAYDILIYAVARPYRGHLLCPCNSGKKTRDCHPVNLELLAKFNNKSVKKALLCDLKIIQDEISSYERNTRKAKNNDK